MSYCLTSLFKQFSSRKVLKLVVIAGSAVTVSQFPAHPQPPLPSVAQQLYAQSQPVVSENQQTIPQILPVLVSPSPGNFSSALERSYLLGAGDVLRMEFFNLPDYSRDYQVAVDGYLTLPLIGSILVRGMTLEELRFEAFNRYKRYIRQPIITFEMIEARPLQIAIAGEVNRPGAYTVAMSEQPGANGMTPPTLTQIIRMADGITQSADIRRIEVSRNNPDAAARKSVIYVSLWDLLTLGNVNADIALQDGDSVKIPTATIVDPGEATTLATASFSPDAMSVYVVGEVGSPGRVEIPPSTPLNQALLAAGGFNERAQTASVDLVRLNVNGTVTQRNIRIDLAANIDEENNPLLQQNDTIVVKRSGASTFSDVAGNFIPPFNLLINLFRAIGGN